MTSDKFRVADVRQHNLPERARDEAFQPESYRDATLARRYSEQEKRDIMKLFPGFEIQNRNERGTERGAERTGDRPTEIRTKDAVVLIPPNFDPSKPAHFMTYFNGWRSGYQHGYDSARLPEQMKNAPPNTVLIAARWQDVEQSENSSMRRFQQNGGLSGTLNNIFHSVPQLGRRDLKSGDTIGVAGFSAGYNPVRSVLQDPRLAPRVNNIVLLDSPSEAVRDYVRNNLDAFRTGQKKLTMIAGDWRNSDYREFERALGGRQHAGVRFEYTRTEHGKIPAEYFRKAWQ